MLRRFLSLFAACVILFCVSAPAFATGTTAGGIGIPIVGNINFDIVDFADACRERYGGWGNWAWHLIDEDVCTHAPQLGGGHKFVPVRTSKDGQIGMYYQCQYCGRTAGDMIEEPYQHYVDELPATQIDSSGSFLWRPSWGDFVSRSPIHYNYGDSSNYVNGYLGASQLQASGSQYYAGSWAIRATERGSVVWTANAVQRYIEFDVVRAPWDARYVSISGAVDFYGLQGTTMSAGATVSGSTKLLTCSWPEYRVTLLRIDDFSGGADRVASVSASGDGMYGYIGGDGMLYQSTVRDIYNETTNVYTNPVTGTTQDVSGWNYNYVDRSYTLNTASGDTVTVTYGDENVTINDAGTTYNVYYLVEESEEVLDEPVHVHSYSSTVTTPPTCTGTGVRTYTCSGCGDSYTETIPATGHSFGAPVVTTPATCTGTGIQTATCSVCGETVTQAISATGHSYSSEITMEPTCTGTGVRTFTCSECGDTYSVSISATGHKWRIVRQIPSVFDEDGQPLSDGYTLYQCDTCGEQYKVTAESDGTALPSPAPDGASTSSTDLIQVDPSVGRGFLATIARGLTEDLPEAVRAASLWFTELPKLYDGYVSFLRTAIAWLPDDIQALLRFGFGFPVFCGIVRKVWGR